MPRLPEVLHPHPIPFSGAPSKAPKSRGEQFRDWWERFTLRKKPPEPLVETYSENPPKKHQNILLPDGVPVFYLHGTWATTTAMKPVIDFIATIRTNHPSYMSYIPEVREGTGIESVDDQTDVFPAYQLATRDMGDFQFQFIQKNLTLIQGILNQPPWRKNKALGEFFHIIPKERALLVPVIQNFLKTSVFDVSPKINTSESLASIVEQAVGRVHREFDKLEISHPNDKQGIMDTHLLYNRALGQSKTLNLNMSKIYHDPNVINFRPLNLNDVTFLNAYLMFLEQALTEDVEKAYRKKELPLSEKELKEHSKKIAQKLMEAIAPRGMVFGHSQGGTVLISALLKYFSAPPLSPEEAFNLNSPEAKLIGARYIGLAALFSSPLHGIPDDPLWARPLYAPLEKLEKKLFGSWGSTDETLTKKLFKKLIWAVFAYKKPAIPEMRDSSLLMRKFQQQVNAINQNEVTVISAHDKNDTFVEPSATLLTNETGTSFSNVFNIALNPPKVGISYLGPTDVIETEIRRFHLRPDGLLVMILRHLPQWVHNFLYNTYKGSFGGLEQHRSLLNHPAKVHGDLGTQLIKNPKKQMRLLELNNFEPFRRQSLIARRRITAREIIEKPLPEALDALVSFTRTHPDYLSQLLKNAQLNLPFDNSASFEATALLEDLLHLMELAIKEGSFSPPQQEVLAQSLGQISSAHLLPLPSKHTSLSDQADHLLEKLNARAA